MSGEAARSALPALPRESRADASAAPSPLPPVRDPVMHAVLDWIYQFGSAQRRLKMRTAAAAAAAAGRVSATDAEFVRQLQSAAETAAAAGDAGGGLSGAVQTPNDARWVDGCGTSSDVPPRDNADWSVRYPPGQGVEAALRCAPASVSQPSTRNLGSTGQSSGTSDTGSASSSSTLSPSLPSSLHTNTSSTLTDTNWENRIERADRQPRQRRMSSSSARVRPVLDAQQQQQQQQQSAFQFPYRRRPTSTDLFSYERNEQTGDAVKKTSAAVVGSGSSDAATTRYTTSTSSNGSSGSSSNRGGGHPHRRAMHASQVVGETTAQANKTRGSTETVDGSAMSACAMGSELLPPQVSAEVQAALAAALRAHHRATEEGRAAEEEKKRQRPAQQSPKLQVGFDVAETSTERTDTSPHYAVSPPARLMEVTARQHSLHQGTLASRVRPPPSPSPPPPSQQQRSPAKEASPFFPGVEYARVSRDSPHTRHASANAAARRSPSAQQWDEYSLTSASTSSHGTHPK